MKTVPFSVDSILRSTVTRLALFGLTAILVVFFSQFFVLSYQSHKAACEIVTARFSQYMGPLSRELALGEQDIANSMFHEFINVISSTGAKPNLEMSSDLASGAFTEPACRASIFSATVRQPVSFAGKNLAVISGKVFYFPTIPLVLFLLAVIVTLAISIRNWALRLIRRIQNFLILPIKELSIGQEIHNPRRLPIEVQDVSRNINQLKLKLVEEGNRVAQLARENQMGEMAVQVAHDIESPLSVFDMMDRDDFKFTNESRALMIAASKRIQGIAKSLTQRYRLEANEKNQGGQSAALASIVIESIVAEKRALVEHKGIVISLTLESSARNIFVATSSVELGRAVSNLIDNAIESFQGSNKDHKEIKVRVALRNSSLEIEISDYGRGIEPEMLPTLTQKGTTSKSTGLGLGLFSARSLCEAAGGNLHIDSKVGLGTTVTMKLPPTKPPSWFAVGSTRPVPADSKFDEKSDNTSDNGDIDLALIDDDDLIGQMWKLDADEENLRIAVFESVEKFLAADVPRSKPIFLDQHLGNDVLGTKVASQIWDRGYKKIHLTSAYYKIENVPDFISSVRNKQFPDRSVLANPGNI